MKIELKKNMRGIKKQHDKQNECWINAINDFDGETLMSTTKRNVLTRAKQVAILDQLRKQSSWEFLCKMSYPSASNTN